MVRWGGWESREEGNKITSLTGDLSLRVASLTQWGDHLALNIWIPNSVQEHKLESCRRKAWCPGEYMLQEHDHYPKNVLTYMCQSVISRNTSASSIREITTQYMVNYRVRGQVVFSPLCTDFSWIEFWPEDEKISVMCVNHHDNITA